MMSDELISTVKASIEAAKLTKKRKPCLVYSPMTISRSISAEVSITDFEKKCSSAASLSESLKKEVVDKLVQQVARRLVEQEVFVEEYKDSEKMTSIFRVSISYVPG